MSKAAITFERDWYVPLPFLLKEPKLSQFYRYACRIAQTGKIGSGDGQVPETPYAYGDFMMDGLLNVLLPEIEDASGLRLFPTCSYFRLYKRGDTLAKHTDRSSCEISVTLCLGFEAAKLWPIWIEGPGGVSSFNLNPGDAVLYRGKQCPHWRDPFQGRLQAQVFLHYVDQNGPYAEWKFDKRPSTSGLQLTSRV